MEDFKPTMKLRWERISIGVFANVLPLPPFPTGHKLQQLWIKEKPITLTEMAVFEEQWRDIDVVEEDKSVKV